MARPEAGHPKSDEADGKVRRFDISGVDPRRFLRNLAVDAEERESFRWHSRKPIMAAVCVENQPALARAPKLLTRFYRICLVKQRCRSATCPKFQKSSKYPTRQTMACLWLCRGVFDIGMVRGGQTRHQENAS
jgi:hypothetical protein